MDLMLRFCLLFLAEELLLLAYFPFIFMLSIFFHKMLSLRIVCCFALIALVLSFNNTLSASYSSTQAEKSLWLSAAAYCGHSAYQTHTFKGPTSGFVVTYVIYDSLTDTQGYIGYLPSDKSIYVVFRGSQSTANWITNLDAVKTSYTSFPECKCSVHKGFYNTEQRVISGIVSEVKKLQSQHSGFAVKVTGHSLGAALAQLASMDLFKNGISNSVYDFGQPRTGDKTYASFATARVPTFRVTHNKDQVPHLPVTTGMEFYHLCYEEFEDANGKVRTCDNSCEDPTCADQYALKDTNWDDHSIYLGLHVNCAAVS